MTGDDFAPGLLPAPRAFDLGPAGRAPDGRYLGPIADVSTAKWDGRGPFARRRRQRKAWIYTAAFTPRFTVGLAVVDAGFLATAFVYVHDRQREVFTEQKAVVPAGFPAGFQPSLDVTWRVARGPRNWEITRSGAGWAAKYSGSGLGIGIDIDDHGRGLTAISSAPGRPFHHTYKLCSLKCRLSVRTEGRMVTQEGHAALDFSLGYPPRDTRWNWASLDGMTADGQQVGINLVAHFMNGLENALWIDGAVIPLGQAVFTYEPENTLDRWNVATVDGYVNIDFYPDGERKENLRAGVMASVFSQPFGRFEGHIRTRSGLVPISGRGVTEQHRAVW
ncbi:DUF2804 domain-containing protein [Hoyosella subflava]|uniref:DUF2804 domain-containing protein n=1 Tax=Hoyosella subflava (strain DSM 45089 / JCM 17490 / NBRC 109087 / DQS3-9A1) TaxID=443218 RepID=F6EQS7_HOYSD|nr:DUF2804 domain-containing protein [Hoyosella subflava]AEF39538.1 hypothetical protein AS9A_1086 [Hoyosella subflava DQS3-9A1]